MSCEYLGRKLSRVFDTAVEGARLAVSASVSSTGDEMWPVAGGHCWIVPWRAVLQSELSITVAVRWVLTMEMDLRRLFSSQARLRYGVLSVLYDDVSPGWVIDQVSGTCSELFL